MRAGLVGYFDLGSSAGLSDAALREDLREPLPDIGMVGLLNPLGQGTVVDLLGSQILSAWRQGAVAQISRPEMELGWREEWSAPGQFVLDSTSTANPSGVGDPNCGSGRPIDAVAEGASSLYRAGVGAGGDGGARGRVSDRVWRQLCELEEHLLEPAGHH
jgi:hypothetical protein